MKHVKLYSVSATVYSQTSRITDVRLVHQQVEARSEHGARQRFICAKLDDGLFVFTIAVSPTDSKPK